MQGSDLELGEIRLTIEAIWSVHIQENEWEMGMANKNVIQR